jgi:hypothetical protein
MLANGSQRSDKVDSLALLLPRTNLEYDVLERVIQLSNNDILQIDLREVGNMEDFLICVNHCKRVLNSHTPAVHFIKLWTPIKVKPKAYIGVGYSDKGHLGESPSWKDQFIPAEDEPLQTEQTFFRTLLSLG